MFIVVLGPTCSGKNKLIEFLVERHNFIQLSIESGFIPESCVFNTTIDLLTYVTRNWQQNFIIRDIHQLKGWELLLKRPFTLLVSINAPCIQRYKRLQSKLQNANIDFKEFVAKDDELLFGTFIYHK